MIETKRIFCCFKILYFIIYIYKYRYSVSLSTSSESEHEMESGLFLDVIIAESTTVLKLLSGKNEALLIGRNALLVLNLGLDVLDAIWSFDIESDSLASEGLDEDLHATSESENQVKGRLFLDVVVAESAAVFELLAREDQSLLIRGDALFVLDLSLDIFNWVRGLDVQGNSFSGECLNEDLHFFVLCVESFFYLNVYKL